MKIIYIGINKAGVTIYISRSRKSAFNAAIRGNETLSRSTMKRGQGTETK